jgi:hypothetical protein
MACTSRRDPAGAAPFTPPDAGVDACYRGEHLLFTRGRRVVRRTIAVVAAAMCAAALLVSPAGAEKPNFDDYCQENPNRCDVGGGGGGGNRPF